MQRKKTWIILNLIVLAGILVYSANRDYHLYLQYPGDLRNRVIGSRLQKDGKIPYFFHWHMADSPRYADPYVSPGTWLRVSNITASPFFHELLYPISDLPEKTTAFIWLWLQYILLAGMVWMVSRLTSDPHKKLLVLNVGVLLTLTVSWIELLREGQFYLINSFLICGIACALQSNNKRKWIIAGVCAAMLLLIRPVALVIFIPFLFQFRKWLPFILSVGAALVIYGLFVITKPSEKLLWNSYRAAVKEHIWLHQYGDPNELFLYGGPAVSYLEGYDFKKVHEDSITHLIPVATERGNVYIIYNNITHRNFPLKLLNGLSVAILIFLSVSFFFFARKHAVTLIQIICLGYVIYDFVELFSPIQRFQYYLVQWYAVLLLALIFPPSENGRKIFYLFYCLGFILTTFNPPWIPDRNTLGELAWICALLILSFNLDPTNLKSLWKQPSSWAPDRRA